MTVTTSSSRDSAELLSLSVYYDYFLPFFYCYLNKHLTIIDRSVTIIMMSWIWALGWSVCPLVGWGAYAMDGIMGTCSYDYVSQTTNNKTHILAATVANYVLPVITIAGCYYFIVQAVFKHEEELRSQAKKMNVASLRSNADQQTVSAEIRIAKVYFISIDSVLNLI